MTTMGPTAPSLAQSESKAMFFSRLSLDERNMMHRHLYNLMKEEASAGWKRMTSTRDSLSPLARQDASAKPPYTFSQMDEKAVQREILVIYSKARPETKILYDLGRDIYQGQEENWIIRWVLWHVFRYRDDRNSGPRRPARAESTDTDMSTQTPPEAIPETGTPVAQETRDTLQPSSGVGHTSQWYDPVRGVYR